jgi:hypothetical protein
VIDYNRMATVIWTNESSWFETQRRPVEECCDELTLKQAVTFVIEDLDAGCLKSVIVRCGAEKYNFFDIESMYVDLGRLRPQGLNLA